MHSLFSSKAIILFFSLLFSASIVSFELSADNARIRGPKNTDVGEQGKQYGPIRETDTLWRIATKLRPDDSVSIYQVMQAIFQKNPSSFLDNNINHLKTGAYLRLPSVPEIRSINADLAQERSELDDELWDKKLKGQISQPEINLVIKQAENAKTQDVIVAKEELSQEIQQAKVAQQQKLDQLKDEFQSSVSNVEAILIENEKLKQQVLSLSNELKLIRGYLDTDRQTLDELKTLLADQHRILAEQEAKSKADEQSLGLHKFTNNPLLLLIIGLVPGILIVVGITYWMRLRNKPPTIEPSPVFGKSESNTASSTPAKHIGDDLSQAQQQPMAQTRDELLDDALDLPIDDSLEPSSDNIVALDDSLDAQEQSLNLTPAGMDQGSSEKDGLIEQNELDSLLDENSDELDANQPIENNQISHAVDSDDMASMLEQDYELPNEQLDNFNDPDDLILTDSEIALDIPEEQEPSSDEIAHFADVDAIMDELSDEIPVSASQHTEIKLDMDDIDAMIDEVESDDTNFDDLDLLLEEVTKDNQGLAKQETTSNPSQLPETNSEDISDDQLTSDNEAELSERQTEQEVASFDADSIDADSIDEEAYVDNLLGDPLFETIYESAEPKDNDSAEIEQSSITLSGGSVSEPVPLSSHIDDLAEQLDDVVTIDLADDNLIDDLVTIELAEEKNDATEDDDIPSHASVDFGDDPLAAELTDTDMAELSSAEAELIVNEQLEQAAEHLTNEQSASSNEITTSDKLDDNIISGDLNDTDDLLLDELESSDFDSLLDEIAGSESPDNAPQVDINSDDLLTLQNDVVLPPSNGVDIKQPDYLDIDTLLEQSDESLLEEEPYNNIDMDVGLGDFDDLLAGEDSLDVDKESEGFSAKLDLAKAYLEINDSESALKVIDDVIENGPSEVQNEAQSIKEQLAES